MAGILTDKNLSRYFNTHTEKHNSNSYDWHTLYSQGFIASVRDLLHVREDAHALNTDVVSIDKDMRDSVSKVAER